MSLVINNVEDFVHILETNPEWRQRIKCALFDADREALQIRLEKATTDLAEIDRKLSATLDKLPADSA